MGQPPAGYGKNRLRQRSTRELSELVNELRMYQGQSQTGAVLHDYYQTRIDVIAAELERRNPKPGKRKR